jgi:histidinol-phosphate phosphatase family protein
MKAVILAGGKGERLRPLTNVMPKALAPINGIPIIKRQIDNLITLGIMEILVLTGYRSDMISNYLKAEYAKSQVELNCVKTPVDFSPAERLLDVSQEVGGTFLLLYCDNLVEDLASIREVIKSYSPLTFLVEKREQGNVSILPRVLYDSVRSQESPYVELGFIKIAVESFFSKLRQLNSLQMTLKELSHEYDCKAVKTANALQSVSNISRFNKLRRNRKTLLLDRDGILNKKMPARTYLSKIEDYMLLEDNLDALAEHFSPSTDYIIITNQPGVATKEVSTEFLDSLHSQIITEMLIRGMSVIGCYVCTHHWEDDCDCRKPKPGMINQAKADYELHSENLVYIGDEDKDIIASKNANILGIKISKDGMPGSFDSISAASKEIDRKLSFLHLNRE